MNARTERLRGDVPPSLPSEVWAAIGGAGGLGAILLAVRIMSVALKSWSGARLAEQQVQLADAQMRLAVRQAEQAGVGLLGDVVKRLKEQYDTLEVSYTQLEGKYSELEHRERSFRGLVLRMIGGISLDLVSAVSIDDMRSRVRARIDEFKREADWT